jgi:F-type H+-transporting ATPase subunit epsilon
MAKAFSLKIVTPEKLFYEGEVEMLIVRTTSGDEGFMADHTWACKLLVPGQVRFKEIGAHDFRTAAVTGGCVDVRSGTLLYADAVEWQTENPGGTQGEKPGDRLHEKQDDPQDGKLAESQS